MTEIIISTIVMICGLLVMFFHFRKKGVRSYKEIFHERESKFEGAERIESNMLISMDRIWIFLLFNIVFASAYSIVNSSSPNSFSEAPIDKSKIIEKNKSELNIVELLYFSTVTGGTVGYGDFAPRNVYAQIIVVIHILLIFGISSAFFLKFKKYLQAIYDQVGPRTGGGASGPGGDRDSNPPTTLFSELDSINNKIKELTSEINDIGWAIDIKNNFHISHFLYKFRNDRNIFFDGLNNSDLERKVKNMLSEKDYKKFSELIMHPKNDPIGFEYQLDLFFSQILSSIKLEEAAFVRYASFKIYF